MLKLVSNTLWLMADKLIPLGMLFAVNILVARYLGAEDFGRLSVLIALVSFLLPLVSLGLSNAVTREVVNQVRPEGVIIGTVVAFRALAALIASGLIVLYFLIAEGFSSQTSWLITLMSLALIFQSLNVVEFWVNAKENNHNLLFFRTPAIVLSAGLKLAAIYYQLDMRVFALLWASDIVLQSVFIGLTYLTGRGAAWRIDWRYGLQLLKKSWWIIASGFSAIIYLKVDQVMVASLQGDEAAGFYAAASRLTEIWFFLPVTITAGVFPALLRSKQSSDVRFDNQLKKLSTLLFYLAFVIAAFVSLAADEIVHIVYGPAFQAAAVIVQLHIWVCVFVFVRAMLSKWLIAEHLAPYSLISHGTGACINVICNFYLIPIYGAVGAAYATLMSMLVSSVLVFFCFPATRYIFYVVVRSPFPFMK
jgi:PST family polysaccharide transporter